MQSAIKNPEKLIAAINDFADFIDLEYDGLPISFIDESSFLGSKEGEGYKMSVALLAQDELQYQKWDESWINSGKISERCYKAMRSCDNLLDHRYEIPSVKNMIDPKHKEFNPEAERTFYDIYKSSDEKKAFEQAMKTFGKHYALIAYLFFIKAPSRFLPVSPEHFDKNVFPYLGTVYGLEVNYEKLSGKCSWENYIGFINIVKEVLQVMQSQEDIFNVKELRLIDAHSFLWIIGWEDFQKWNKEHK